MVYKTNLVLTVHKQYHKSLFAPQTVVVSSFRSPHHLAAQAFANSTGRFRSVPPGGTAYPAGHRRQQSASLSNFQIRNFLTSYSWQSCPSSREGISYTHFLPHRTSPYYPLPSMSTQQHRISPLSYLYRFFRIQQTTQGPPQQPVGTATTLKKGIFTPIVDRPRTATTQRRQRGKFSSDETTHPRWRRQQQQPHPRP